MKKLLFTVLVSIIFLSSFGQAYHPLIRSDFYWDVLDGDATQICNVEWGYQYFFEGDTIISGKRYFNIKNIQLFH